MGFFATNFASHTIAYHRIPSYRITSRRSIIYATWIESHLIILNHIKPNQTKPKHIHHITSHPITSLPSLLTPHHDAHANAPAPDEFPRPVPENAGAGRGRGVRHPNGRGDPERAGAERALLRSEWEFDVPERGGAEPGFAGGQGAGCGGERLVAVAEAPRGVYAECGSECVELEAGGSECCGGYLGHETWQLPVRSDLIRWSRFSLR
ncbi:hypothetical protein EYC84_008163 [Monilinia fructicola]|uniref:Uncharacterized protein n=1 Tax=Monilinia fructicola TaxID=38448 RepID=A0A5M9JGA2_MONFR|nr:hypothetical protein EYC84_008163 [Monilinia fructicola]